MLEQMLVNNKLGPLERDLMESIWILGEASVTQVQQGSKLRLAYTTIMTTLDRLYKKGLLERRKQGRAYLYAPRLSKAEFELGLVSTTLHSLIAEHSTDGVPFMANLVESLQEYDTKMLDDLENLIQRKKRQKRER